MPSRNHSSLNSARAIVATKTLGTIGVLDNTTAIIAKVDDPEDLASAIMKGLTDPIRAEKIADSAYDCLVRNYTWDKLGPKYEASFIAVFPSDFPILNRVSHFGFFSGC